MAGDGWTWGRPGRSAGRTERRDAPVAQVGAAEHVAGGLARDREDDLGGRVDLLEAVEGAAARVEAHAAQPHDLVAAAELEQPALLGAGGDDLEELLLVVVFEPVAAGQQPVERVGHLGGAGVEAGRQGDGNDGLLGDHRPAVDDAQAPHPPDLVARPELEGVGERRRRAPPRDVEHAGRDLVRAVLLGERAEESAGAPRLAHYARPGDERADALMAVHAALLFELGERPAHGDQAHAGHGGELGAAGQQVARGELLLGDQALDHRHDVLVAQAPGRRRRRRRPSRRPLPRLPRPSRRPPPRYLAPLSAARMGNTSAAAASVWSMSAALCTRLTNRFSNWLGWKITPRSSISCHQRVKRASSA